VVEVTSNDDMVCCEVGLPGFFPQSGFVFGCPRCIGVDDGQLSAVGEVEGQVLRRSLCYDSVLLMSGVVILSTRMGVLALIR
jgi:hypothetical protein